jgi:hypothetical protein
VNLSVWIRINTPHSQDGFSAYTALCFENFPSYLTVGCMKMENEVLQCFVLVFMQHSSCVLSVRALEETTGLSLFPNDETNHPLSTSCLLCLTVALSHFERTPGSSPTPDQIKSNGI